VAFGFGLAVLEGDRVGLADTEGLAVTELPGLIETVGLALGVALARLVRVAVGEAIGFAEMVGLGVALPVAPAGLRPSVGISKASTKHALFCLRFITGYFQLGEGKCQ